jgi:hypothetical protein
VGTVWATVQAAMYVELREAKNGPETGQLEEIFA